MSRLLQDAAVDKDTKRIRTGVIGCGSVSGSYLPALSKCPYVEVVSRIFGQSDPYIYIYIMLLYLSSINSIKVSG